MFEAGRSRQRAKRVERPRARVLGAVLLWTSGLFGCSVGHGEGELTGTASLGACRGEGAYSLRPNAFFAQSVQELLKIRVQRGSDAEVLSDGLAVLVHDASAIQREQLGTEIDLASADGPTIDVTVYFNDTCPPGRADRPIVLRPTRGTIRFENIYAPEVDSGVRIQAELTDVRFEDTGDTNRWAELSGYFDFLYVRGRPAQRYP